MLDWVLTLFISSLQSHLKFVEFLVCFDRLLVCTNNLRSKNLHHLLAPTLFDAQVRGHSTYNYELLLLWIREHGQEWYPHCTPLRALVLVPFMTVEWIHKRQETKHHQIQQTSPFHFCSGFNFLLMFHEMTSFWVGILISHPPKKIDFIWLHSFFFCFY